MRPLSVLLISAAALVIATASTAHASDAAICTISRAALSFVSLDSPFAIDGQCCDSIQRIRALRPAIALNARCDENAEESDPLCEAGGLGVVRISETDLTPNDTGCLAFHIALPMPPDARHLWEREIALSIVARGPQPQAAPVGIVLADEGRPQYALTHVGFDTTASGQPEAANLRINVVPSKNPPSKVRYACLAGAAAGPAPSAAAPSSFSPALLQKWADATGSDGECIADGSCGEIVIPLTGRVDVSLAACRGGTLVAGIVYPGTDAAFIDAMMAAAKKQKGGALPKATPATIFSPREEWEIALVEGALQLGFAGYLFIADPAAVADNFLSIPIPSAGQGAPGTR